MSKYNIEFKLKVTEEYLTGTAGGIRTVAKKYNVPKRTLENWIIKYRTYGRESFYDGYKSNEYTRDFKSYVIEYMERNNTSFSKTAMIFKVSDARLVSNWYKEEIEGRKSKKGTPSESMKNSKKPNKKQSKDLNPEERIKELERENQLLRMELAYEKKLQAMIRKKESGIEKKQ